MSDATRVAIVGLGVIGGSAALRLLDRGVTPHGYCSNDQDRIGAADAGVSVHADIGSAVADADLVLIAVPLDQLAAVATAVVGSVGETTTIVHASSLQSPTSTSLGHDAGRVIGTRPLAGNAGSGFSAAAASLFRGATVLAEDRASRQQREDIELFWSMAGATRIEYLTAEEHDARMGVASHLPQLAAVAMASVMSGGGIARRQLGPGGRDMTRLAGSPWEMWGPLLAASPASTLDSVRALAAELGELANLLALRDVAAIRDRWDAAGQWAVDR